MGHIDLRALKKRDADAVFAMMREPEGVRMAAFTTEDPDDRTSFDEWMSRHRASPDVEMYVITEDGDFVGTAGAFTIDSDREVTYWVRRAQWGRGIATEALRILVSREPVRPLFARAAAANLASIAVLTKVGFTEVSRDTAYAPGVAADVEEIVFVLVPTLD